jgi:lactoylglutathione lyase
MMTMFNTGFLVTLDYLSRGKQRDIISFDFVTSGCVGIIRKPWLSIGGRIYYPNSEETRMRILHTMLRVGNLERSVEFIPPDRVSNYYSKKTIRRVTSPSLLSAMTLILKNSVIELTYTWDIDHYELGNGYGHIALEVDDVYQACEDIRQRGGKIIREAGPMNSWHNHYRFCGRSRHTSKLSPD